MLVLFLTDSSCISISTKVFSSVSDQRANQSVGNLITYPIHTLRKAPMSIVDGRSLPRVNGYENAFGVGALVYESVNTGIGSDLTQKHI
jgi:hypothetical protein